MLKCIILYQYIYIVPTSPVGNFDVNLTKITGSCKIKLLKYDVKQEEILSIDLIAVQSQLQRLHPVTDALGSTTEEDKLCS